MKERTLKLLKSGRNDYTEIKEDHRAYYEQLYANKITDEMNKFLEKHKPPKLTQ